MSLSHNIVAVNSDDAVILTVPSNLEKDYSKSLTISIQNLDSTHFIFLGSSEVTASSYGFRLNPGQTFTADLEPNEEIYAITDTGTTNVATLWIQR